MVRERTQNALLYSESLRPCSPNGYHIRICAALTNNEETYVQSKMSLRHCRSYCEKVCADVDLDIWMPESAL